MNTAATITASTTRSLDTITLHPNMTECVTNNATFLGAFPAIVTRHGGKRNSSKSPFVASRDEVALDSKKDFIVTFLDTFRYLIFLLNLGGIRLPGTTAKNQQNVIGRIKVFFFQVYKVIIALLHVISIARVVTLYLIFIPIFRQISSAMLIIAGVYSFFSTIILCTLLLAVNFHFIPFMTVLQNYAQDFGFLQDITKRKLKVKVTSFIVMFTVVISSIFLILQRDEVNTALIFAFWNKQWGEIPAQVFYGVQTILIMCPLMTSFIFYSYILSILGEEFELTAARLKESLMTYNGDPERQFNKLRERHQGLCRIVAMFNKLTRVSVFACMFFVIALTYTFVYGMADRSSSRNLLLLIGALLHLCIIVSLTTKWGQLPVAVSRVVDVLADVDWSCLPDKLVNKMAAFISLCSSRKVGVDVFGLFTIDSTTPLMITGTILTYGIVIIELSDGKQASVCNGPFSGNVTEFFSLLQMLSNETGTIRG